MSPAGGGAGGGNNEWKIESRHNKQLRLQQNITTVCKQAAEGNDKSRGMFVEIRPACWPYEGVSIQKAKAGAAYIADFLCKELKLVIEVDGITHQDDETGEKDKQKTSDLESAGFKVIRFTDEEVLKNMNGVMKKIERVVEEMEMSSPPPAPPPAGDSYPLHFRQ